VSKILISGCGLSWSEQERPSWVKVLKICGLDIDDRAGPAISNQLILNRMIEAVMDNNYSHAICQLTSTGKLDVEMTNEERRQMAKGDTVRNFLQENYWPSSVSREHESKRLYYEYLHSPAIEQSDIIYKWMLLKKLCDEKGVILHTVLGYKIDWVKSSRYRLIETDHDWNIWNHYLQGKYYNARDLSPKNTVPNKYYMIALAKHINNNFLKQDIGKKLGRFDG